MSLDLKFLFFACNCIHCKLTQPFNILIITRVMWSSKAQNNCDCVVTIHLLNSFELLILCHSIFTMFYFEANEISVCDVKHTKGLNNPSH